MSLACQKLQQLLDQTKTHPKIKQTLKLIALTRQKITYHAMVSSSDTYLHLRGLANHDQDEFNYINKLLHTKIVGVIGKIKRKQLSVNNIQQEHRRKQQLRYQQQNQVNQQLIAEVEHVLNNIDLPLSLFKRNDKYWYQDNPKTIQAKNYVHQRIKQDRQRKKRMQSQQIKKQTDRQKRQQQKLQKQIKEQQQRKKQYRQQIKNKIEGWKKLSQQRQKSIQQSQKYTSSLKPKFLKIRQQDDRQRASALQQHKKRLSELRKLHKSIDLTQIQQRQNKLIQMQKQKQMKKIFDQPLKVSFKSKYHTSMTARSRIGQYETTKSLYEKKKQYGTIIKKEFRPKIDQQLVQQMEERLKILRRKRARKNPKKKNDKKKGKGQDDDDDDEDYEDEQEQQNTKVVQKQEPPKQQNSDDDDDSQDDKPPRRVRGEDEDPDRSQRYQLGVAYLQYVRNLRKKKKQQNSNGNQNQSKMEGQNNVSEVKGKTSSRYKDYLKQFVKTNLSTVDYINTRRMKQQYNKSIIGNNKDNYSSITRLQNQARLVDAKVNRQEQLLKHKKMKNQQAIAKKVQIDNAVVETIKARLAMMGR